MSGRGGFTLTSEVADNTLPEGVPSQIWFNGKFISIEEYRLMQLERDLLPHRALGNSNSDVWYDKPAGSLPNEVDGYSSASCVGCPESGRPEGATSSLGTVVRITDTTSDIGVKSLQKLKELRADNPLKEYYNLASKFCQYLHDCEQRTIHITGYNTKTGKMVHVPLDYDNRWNPNTRLKLSYKLDQLEYWFNLQVERPVTLISLTSYQKGQTIRQQWDKLNCSRTLLLKLIRKYFGDIDYFWVPEPHQTGYVHYHLAVFAKIDNDTKDKKGQGIEDKFRNLWSEKYKTGSHTYGLDFTKRTGDNPLNKLKDYLTKYLRKGFALDDWTPELLVFNALLWDTGYRLYGASKRLSAIMKIEPQPQRDTVWLKTEIDMGEGEMITRPSRLYIPEWLDSDFWLFDGKLAIVDPPPKYIYDWGRQATGRIDPIVHRWVSRGKWTT